VGYARGKEVPLCPPGARPRLVNVTGTPLSRSAAASVTVTASWVGMPCCFCVAWLLVPANCGDRSRRSRIMVSEKVADVAPGVVAVNVYGPPLVPLAVKFTDATPLWC